MKYFKYSSLLFSLIILISACSSKTEQELFDTSVKLINEQKYDDALAAFNNILDEYPDGELNCRVLFEIGKLYHGKVISNVDPKESLKKGIDFYFKSYEKCPASPEAPNALFMAAFIQANELNELEAAKATYKKFIDEFPDNEMVESAKIELENLGVSPEDFLKEKISSEN